MCRLPRTPSTRPWMCRSEEVERFVQIYTKYFGRVKYEDTDVLHFQNGLFGFEDEKRFLLLPFAGGGGALLCFQSVVTPGLAFVAMNPFSLKPDYAPLLSEEDLNVMGVTRSQELCYYTLCVVRSPVSHSTVNLKCPVAVNEETRRAVQVILETPEYGMRHPLSEFSRKEESGQC